MEVEEIEPPTPAMAKAIQSIKDGGIYCLFGKWLIPGSPYVLLFDIGSAGFRKNEWKGDLWNVAGIPSPEGDLEMDDAIVFGYLVTWFLGEVD